MTDECECVYENDIQVFECEWCYYRYNEECWCKYDHIDPNCPECF